MAPLLHDAGVRDQIRDRLRQLSASATPRWGKMSVDQMLWHCNESLRVALGRRDTVADRPRIPVRILKVMALRLPWPRSAPTARQFRATERYSFHEEQAASLELIDAFTARGIETREWGTSPILGPITGREWSLLQAKHFNHHLKQFGV